MHSVLKGKSSEQEEERTLHMALPTGKDDLD